MDDDQVRRATTDERLDLCRLLEGLPPADWETPSLCPGWTVRDVVAHLGQELTFGAMVRGGIKARGDFDRMTADMGRSRSAAHAPAELVAELRRSAATLRLAPFSKPADALLDVLVHWQDVARPLGRSRPMDPDRVAPALTHALGSPWYGAKKRFRHVRLVATDLDWSGGTGTSVIHGTAGDLLLLATGRSYGLDALAGPGVDVVRPLVA